MPRAPATTTASRSTPRTPPPPSSSAARLAFEVDAYGNITKAAEGTSTALTTYAYDKADHLTSIDPPGADPTASLTVDAFGRIGSRTVAGVTETLSYLATTEAVLRLDTGSTITDAAITAKGDRTAVKLAGSGRCALPDLHGNTAASMLAADGTIAEALRYDAFGELVDAWPGAGSPSAFARWKFQGNLDVSPTADALYDNGFRFYAPGLGTFTQVDPLIGQAENPLSTNRYLYAGASPWTLTDPTGHESTEYDGPSNSTVAQAKAAARKSIRHYRSTPRRWTRLHVDDEREARRARVFRSVAVAAPDDGGVLGGIVEGVWNGTVGGPSGWRSTSAATSTRSPPVSACWSVTPVSRSPPWAKGPG